MALASSRPRRSSRLGCIITDVLGLDLNSLLSGVVGGMGVLLLSIAYGRWEAKRKRDQELKGLMTLIFHEYGNNDHLMKWLSENPSFVHAPSFTDLQTGVWTESRVRLSQLLAKEHTGALALYYSCIETIGNTIRDDSMPDDVKTDAVLGHIERAEKYGKAAMLHAAQHVFVDDPAYTKEGHERFVTEARRLTTGGDG